MNVCAGAGVPLPGGRQGEHVPAPRPPGGHQPDPLLKYQVHLVRSTKFVKYGSGFGFGSIKSPNCFPNIF